MWCIDEYKFLSENIEVWVWKGNFISLFLFLGIIIFECQENYVLKLFQHMLER